MTLITSVMDDEVAYLKSVLGVNALLTDSIQDLRNKYYEGIVDGTTSPLGNLGTGYAAGEYYEGALVPGSASTLAMTLNQLEFHPIRVYTKHTFTAFVISVNVAGAAGAVVRAGLYDNLNGLPNVLIQELGALFNVETVGQKERVENIILNPGIYWLACVSQVAVCTLDARSSNLNELTQIMNLVSVPSNAGIARQSGVSGALPNPAVVSANGATTPVMALRG